MRDMHIGEKNYSYHLVHKEFNVVHKEDALVIFEETHEYGEQIFIAYFEKENHDWKWRQTRGARWDSPIKWSSMNQVPFIYSGTISDPSIAQIYVGDEQAAIIEVEEGKRFWYAISPVRDAKVNVLKEDGNPRSIEES
ncbi:hypothetical protein AR543_18645 [Paenibacillus bovis]|uniref:Uncharacterized protein n=2 Tax=Paenibacillus bovis TaxID=1616788 RepID=A0A172ZN23_9BACL|nr:hypothetical protein AR543_18645 [Paenibacillus bovis]